MSYLSKTQIKFDNKQNARFKLFSFNKKEQDLSDNIEEFTLKEIIKPNNLFEATINNLKNSNGFNLTNEILKNPSYNTHFSKTKFGKFHEKTPLISKIDFMNLDNYDNFTTNKNTIPRTRKSQDETCRRTHSKSISVINTQYNPNSRNLKLMERLSNPIKVFDNSCIKPINKSKKNSVVSNLSSIVNDNNEKLRFNSLKPQPQDIKKLSFQKSDMRKSESAFSIHFQPQNTSTLDKGSEVDTIYKKVFDKRYYFLINPKEEKKINKFKLANPDYISEHERKQRFKKKTTREVYINDKIKQIKEKIFFMKGIFDYSYPKIKKEMLSMKSNKKEVKENDFSKKFINNSQLNLENEKSKYIEKSCTITKFGESFNKSPIRMTSTEKGVNTTHTKNFIINKVAPKKINDISKVRLIVLKDKGEID